MKNEEQIRERIKAQEEVINIMKEGSLLFPGQEEEIIRTHSYAKQELEWVLAD